MKNIDDATKREREEMEVFEVDRHLEKLQR